ncbi:MAG TPA: 2-amino-4-hydroxy-6-hydroxymethyldihydropteridine diphosphokinase [Phycisphaerales bacterium]|nr:2-amino-4-hydroxy-6-hydroxymethyldihydropteridine diphosphokinase [Phycisphaerales bacterium]
MTATRARQPETAACERACVGIGSNLGDRSAAIERAVLAMATLPGTRLVARSSIHETEPVGPVPQGPFLNAAVVLETALAPLDLLDAFLAIERSLGRARTAGERWGPRIIDLDLLLYGARVESGPRLTLPHPRLHERSFVLEPLAEIAPDAVVPGTARTVRELRDSLRGVALR